MEVKKAVSQDDIRRSDSYRGGGGGRFSRGGDSYGRDPYGRSAGGYRDYPPSMGGVCVYTSMRVCMYVFEIITTTTPTIPYYTINTLVTAGCLTWRISSRLTWLVSATYFAHTFQIRFTWFSLTLATCFTLLATVFIRFSCLLRLQPSKASVCLAIGRSRGHLVQDH